MPKQAKHFTTSDGVGIHYEISRSPQYSHKWVVLIHGLGGDLRAWTVEGEHLNARGYNTVALDLRGHGLSGRPADLRHYSLSRLAQDVWDLIQHEQLEEPTIVGHCLGGMIAITLEAKYPAASNLVLIDTSYKPPVWGQMAAHYPFVKHTFELIARAAPEIGLKSEKDFRAFAGTHDYDVRRIFSDMLHTSLHSYLCICDQMLEYDASNLLSQINVPTLVISGEEDHIFPPQTALELARRIKKSKMEVIPAANHILVINNPEDVVNTIMKFMNVA